MEFERNPERAAVGNLHSAIMAVSDPRLEFDDQQKKSITISLAMLKQAVAGLAGAAAPTFNDYLSARTYAWATGSVESTFNGTKYTKDKASHGIRECDELASGGRCSRCQLDYRRLYGYRQTPRSVTNTASGDVTGTLIQGGDIGSVHL